MHLLHSVEKMCIRDSDFDKADTSSTFGSKVRDRARYSTLQDLDAGRHTEVDMFAGAVVRLGRELGIPTPVSYTHLAVYKRQVDNISIAYTLEVDYTVVIPAVLVITDQKTLRVCGKCCLCLLYTSRCV